MPTDREHDEPVGPRPASSLEADLAAWGKVVVIETRGRRSGLPRRATVGFVEAPHGALLVAAGDEDTQWARNLLSDPRCVVERDGERRAATAVPLEDEQRHAAAAALILKYGTPAERLGSGPAFRLEPAGDRH